jgi:hypothetical protein
LYGLVSIVTIVSAAAQASIVYDNGPPITSDTSEQFASNNAWPIFGTWSVSDSFVLSDPTTLTSAQIALWVNSLYAGTPPNSVQWAIGSQAFLTDVVSLQTGSLASGGAGVYSSGYNLFEETFSLSNTSLTAGTYFLTLTNLQSTYNPSVPSNDAFWAWSASPPAGGTAGVDYYFPPQGYFSTVPESFQLYGDPQGAAVPEPAALIVWSLLAGLGICLGWRWRRKAAA